MAITDPPTQPSPNNLSANSSEFTPYKHMQILFTYTRIWNVYTCNFILYNDSTFSSFFVFHLKKTYAICNFINFNARIHMLKNYVTIL